MSEILAPKSSPVTEIPHGNAAGFLRYLRQDLISGLLVFLIALPLCLGISLASGFPAVAGVFTAIVGAILTTFLSNSELTIKGPAAGLIVIVVGAVTEFGFTGGQDPAADFQAYRLVLAVGVVAGIVQVVFGLIRAGILGDFFPSAAVHGMLAAIGVIIMLKQLPVAVGQSAKGAPFEIIRDLPETLMGLNPDIAIIGGISLLILFGLPFLKKKLTHPLVKLIPGPLVVLLVAVPLGMYFDLSHAHTYTFAGNQYRLGEQFLVTVPNNLWKAIALPDFSSLQTLVGWKWVLMFSLIGSLESMLSAKAVDMLDPFRRKTNLNRDLIAVGFANSVAAFIGGLPMISEIVRSRANIDNGAKTRFADLWHGIFLLAFIALLPALIHRIPLAALAAMLVYTGFRLASPREFVNVYKTGIEQLLIFAVTLVAVLATDLLVGIGIGIAVKFFLHLANGVPLRSLFKPYLEVSTREPNTVIINAMESAVFTNWIPFKRQIEQLGLIQKNDVVVDLSGTRLVDHSVMEKLHEMENEFERAGLKFEVIGLAAHQTLSDHPHATRKRVLVRLRRVTVILDELAETLLVRRLQEFGVSGFTSVACAGTGRRGMTEESVTRNALVRVEVVTVPEVADQILTYIDRELANVYSVTACLETVEVLRSEPFERRLRSSTDDPQTVRTTP